MSAHRYEKAGRRKTLKQAAPTLKQKWGGKGSPFSRKAAGSGNRLWASEQKKKKKKKKKKCERTTRAAKPGNNARKHQLLPRYTATPSRKHSATDKRHQAA